MDDGIQLRATNGIVQAGLSFWKSSNPGGSSDILNLLSWRAGHIVQGEPGDLRNPPLWASLRPTALISQFVPNYTWKSPLPQRVSLGSASKLTETCCKARENVAPSSPCTDIDPVIFRAGMRPRPPWIFPGV